MTREALCNSRNDEGRELAQIASSIAFKACRIGAEAGELLIISSMEKIAEFMPVESGYLYLLDEKEQSFAIKHSWYKDFGNAGNDIKPENIVTADFPGLFEFSDGFPRTLNETNFDSQGEIASLQGSFGSGLLLISIVSASIIAGFFCFKVPTDFCLTDAAGAALQKLGEILANSLEREKMELFQAQSQERLSGILNSLEDAVWATDPKRGHLLFFNPATERILGKTAVDLFENPNLWFDLVHPDDKSKIENWQGQVERSGQAEFEYRILRTDGQVRWLHVRLWMAFSVSGAPNRIDGIATDITERVEAEEKLRSHQNLLANLIESLQSGILVTDENNQIKYLNRQFRNLVGLADEEMGSEQFPDWRNLLSQKLKDRNEEFLQNLETLITNRKLVVETEVNLNRFVTLTFARFDLAARKLEFVDCGHTKTLHYRPSSDKIFYLSGDHCPLGFLRPSRDLSTLSRSGFLPSNYVRTHVE